jgi:hypothetical protein
MFRKYFLLFVTFFLMAGLTRLWAQSAAKDPAAYQVLMRAAQLHGAPPGTVLTVIAGGTYLNTPGKLPSSYGFQVQADGRERVYWRFSAGRKVITSVVNGHFGWVEQSGRRKNLGLSQASGGSVEVLPVLALGSWINGGDVQLKPAESIKIGAKFYTRVVVAPTDMKRNNSYRQALERSRRLELYFDTETYRIERIRYFLHPNDWRIDMPVDVLFSDFRAIGKISWPMVATLYYGDRWLGEYRFANVQINQPVDARIYN